MVVNETGMAADKGMETLKVALAIVLGIVLVFELPPEIISYWSSKKIDHLSNHSTFLIKVAAMLFFVI